MVELRFKMCKDDSLMVMGLTWERCTAKKTVKDSEWFREKMLLAQAQEAGVILQEEQQEFLADGLEDLDSDCDDLQLHISLIFKADHVDAFDSDCDDAPTVSAIFMARLSPARSVNGDVVEINNKSFEINDQKAQLQQKSIVVNELKQLLAKLKGKSQVSSCETPNLDSRIQKLDDKNVSLAFQVSSLEKEREHLKSQPRSNTKNDRIQRPLSRSVKNKVEVQPRKYKSISNKNNHVSYCNANVKNVALTSNSKNVCLSCNECLFFTNHDACVVNYPKDVQKHKMAKSVKQKEKIEWKPTGRIFNTIVEIVLWYLDSGCSKYMTGQRDKLINFVSKFISTVRFGNDHFAAIIGSRGSNLYTISLKDMMKSSLIFLLSKASKTKSWLWHIRLSNLNFGTINELAKEGLVRGLPKLKYARITYVWHVKWVRARKNHINPNLSQALTKGFRGLQISQNPIGIFINQSKYALEMLKKYGLENSDVVDTPMVERSKLDEDLQGTLVDPTSYRSMVSSLMYLTASRPDLVFVVCMCARYQEKPTEKHLTTVKRVVRSCRLPRLEKKYSGKCTVFRRKACQLVIQETEVYCNFNYRSRVRFLVRLLCTKLMDALSVNKLWIRLQ
ncbi:retrovirus-related pol polyprotein from transposon TNT 1-94 [Tanacetum coccineum]|uniref:Retrovirus-related pol polyprotein from transposon TNT 1-94 n=1 Tax=Tanacetum coccineum TaxID=301880 RepID=A0ABQ5BD25_9ASTR